MNDTSRKVFLGVLLALVALRAAGEITSKTGLYLDFSNFYNAGLRAQRGETGLLYQLAANRGSPNDPTVVGYLATPYEFVSAPITAYLHAPMAALPPVSALVVFKTVSAVATALSVLLLWRHWKPQADSAYTFRMASIANLYQPLWSVFLVGGQTTPLVFLTATGALVLHAGGWLWGPAVLLVVLVMIKPAFVVALVFLSFANGWKFLWRVAAVGTLAGLISVSLMGWPVHGDFLRQLGNQAHMPAGWQTNSSLTVAVDTYLDVSNPAADSRPAQLEAILRAVRALVLIFFAWVWLRFRATPMRDSDRVRWNYSLAVLLALTISPVVWEHYLSLLLIPGSCLVARFGELPRGARIVTALFFLTCLAQSVGVTGWIRQFLELTSLGSQLVVSVVKSLPLCLMLVIAGRYPSALAANNR